MSNFSISDILNYAQCGLRSEYPANNKLFDSRESVSAYLVSNLLDYLFESIASKKLPTLERLNKELNIYWSKIKNKITFSLGPNEFVIFQSYAKRLYHHINNFSKIEIIVHNQLFDLKLGEDVIQTPLTIFRSVNNIHSYYIDRDVFIEDNPVGYSIIYPIVYRLTKELCKGHTYTSLPTIYRAQNLRTYQCIDHPDVIQSLKNLVQGIKNKVFFPRTTSNCKLCRNKETCKWYNETN